MTGSAFRSLIRKMTSTCSTQSEHANNMPRQFNPNTSTNAATDMYEERLEVGDERGEEGIEEVQQETGDGPRGMEDDSVEVGEGEDPEVCRRGYIPVGGYDTPVNPVTQKRPLEWTGNQFRNKSASRLIGSIWNLRFTEPWYTFSKVPHEKRIILFNEFKRAYSYDASYEQRVFEIWTKTASSILKKKLHRARKKAKQLRQTTRMINCRDTPPSWIQTNIWNQMIDMEWHKSTYDDKGNTMRNNRLTPKEGTHTRHSAGSVSIASHDAQVELETGHPVSFVDSFSYWHTKREKGKGKVKESSVSSSAFVDNKSKKVYETYMKKKAELNEDVAEWNPRLWVEASGGLTSGRVYGAPYIDTSSLLNKGSKSSILADNITHQEDSTPPNSSASIMLTPEIKKLIEKEVQLAITSKYGSAAPSQPPQPEQPHETPQQFSFLHPANQISQQPGQFPQSSFQFVQPSIPYNQPPGSFQSIPASCQQNFGNFSQQPGPFTQLLGPITNEYNLQPGQYQAAPHHGTFQQSLDDNIE